MSIVKKGETYSAKVVDLTHDGMGVVKIDGYPLFLSNALVGEEVRFKAIKVGKNYGIGRVEERLSDAEDRVPLKDKLGFQTGTMPLQHLSYEGQLRFKQKQVQEALKRIGHLDVEVLPTLAAGRQAAYRNKAQIPVQEIKGKLELGIYRSRSHELIPMTDYYIQYPEIDQTLLVVRNLLRKNDITAYDEETHSGYLRHLIVRYSQRTQQLMLIFVTVTKDSRPLLSLIDQLKEACPQLVSVVHNIQKEKTNKILGLKTKLLWGVDYYEEKLFDLTFHVSPLSFFQVNTEQAERLYQMAIDLSQVTAEETVFDLYCGLGSMTLPFAKRAKKVYGLEVVKEAIDQAKVNANLNGVNNVHFEAGKCEEVLPVWVEEKGLRPDVIVVDPPRKGLDPIVRESILKAQPNRLVYVSCHPGSLARDVKDFVEGGYTIASVQPVDMFPQSSHVESVVLMTKVAPTK